jgi:hypothetical protein
MTLIFVLSVASYVSLTLVTGFDTMRRHVAFYRVFTDQQGRSDLGLETRQSVVDGYLTRIGGDLLVEFSEIESG